MPAVVRIFAVLLAYGVALGVSSERVDVSGVSTMGDRRLADAIVWLDAPAQQRRPRPEPAVLDQINRSFSPRVLAVQVGTRVEFPNHDRVFHNVFSHHDGKVFDLGLYPVGAVKEIPFDKPGLSRVFCNIHPQMSAYVMVLDTPYFAVSDQNGDFVIRDVPPGSYQSHAWRPGGSILNDTFVVNGDRRMSIRWP